MNTETPPSAPTRYRKKPIVVEAVQWWPGRTVRGVENTPHEDGHPARCKTMEGYLGVNPGDYIITGIKGEHYPCREDVFLATYEPV